MCFAVWHTFKNLLKLFVYYNDVILRYVAVHCGNYFIAKLKSPSDEIDIPRVLKLSLKIAL